MLPLFEQKILADIQAAVGEDFAEVRNSWQNSKSEGARYLYLGPFAITEFPLPSWDLRSTIFTLLKTGTVSEDVHHAPYRRDPNTNRYQIEIPLDSIPEANLSQIVEAIRISPALKELTPAVPETGWFLASTSSTLTPMVRG